MHLLWPCIVTPRHNRIEQEHDELSASSLCTSGDRVSEPRRYTLLALVCSVATVWALLAPVPALASITLTESSIRATLVVDTKRPNTDKLTVRGAFRLGSGRPANPVTEAVVLSVGPFSQTLPPGSFKQEASSTETTWIFNGPGSGIKHMVLLFRGRQFIPEVDYSGSLLNEEREKGVVGG